VIDDSPRNLMLLSRPQVAKILPAHKRNVSDGAQPLPFSISSARHTRFSAGLMRRSRDMESERSARGINTLAKRPRWLQAFSRSLGNFVEARAATRRRSGKTDFQAPHVADREERQHVVFRSRRPPGPHGGERRHGAARVNATRGWPLGPFVSVLSSARRKRLWCFWATRVGLGQRVENDPCGIFFFSFHYHFSNFVFNSNSNLSS
jgi:hypothetical protein